MFFVLMCNFVIRKANMRAIIQLVASVVYKNCYKRFYELPITKHLKHGIIALFVEFIVLLAIKQFGWIKLMNYYGVYCSLYMIHTFLLVKKVIIKLECKYIGKIVQHKLKDIRLYINILIILYLIKVIAEINYYLLFVTNIIIILVWLDLIVLQTVINHNYKSTFEFAKFIINSLTKQMRWVISCYISLNLLMMIYATM